LSQGPSVGAVWTVWQTACRLGIDSALGAGFAAQLALWQVLARVLEQGSRLSAVRLAKECGKARFRMASYHGTASARVVSAV